MKESINNRYGYWEVEQVRPYIIIELKKRFPDSVVEREFDDVDLMVHGPNIPVEIQRTRCDPRSGSPQLSYFEDTIRRQIDQNIGIYDKCWFFFDAKLLYHLQNNLSKNSSLNMDWFYQLLKSGKLRAFTVSISGIIKELDKSEFKFIKEFSNTCRLGKEEERRILTRNKSKISYLIYKANGFVTEEIDEWYREYEGNNHGHFARWLVEMGGRKKQLGMIKIAVMHLQNINNVLRCIIKPKEYIPITELDILGIIDRRNGIICIDKYDILKFFPGYFENKELWDYWRTHPIENRIFYAVIRGEYHNYLKDRKKQPTLDDLWS